MKPQHFSEAAWAAGGQGLTALGTLLGVRLLTQFVSPTTYGTLALAVAASSLTLSVANTPLGQAAMFLYPGYAARAGLAELYSALGRCLRRALLWTVPLLAIAGLACAASGSVSLLFATLFIVLLVTDFSRATHQAMLGAARQQRRYALWQAGDAWGRPILATVAVLLLDRSASTVLAAHLVVALTLLIIFNSLHKCSIDEGRSLIDTPATPVDAGLNRRMWAYALPLIPLGIIGWVNNLGDRYFIGATLGLASVGAYAAIYGIASAPFTLFNAAVEQALRPVYQAAVTTQRREHAHQIFKLWLTVIALGGAVGVALVGVWHERIATILLAPPYRHASALMPSISAGYAIRCISYVFERVCYARGETRRVLIVQVCAVVVTLLITPLAIIHWGLAGAAASVPVCFTMQLAAAFLLTRGVRSQTQAFA